MMYMISLIIVITDVYGINLDNLKIASKSRLTLRNTTQTGLLFGALDIGPYRNKETRSS